MQAIEPFYHWRHLYTAEEDEKSVFYGREYSEFEFTNTIYNYYIHPQWDEFGSNTLYLKILFVDYEEGYCIIELIGEWNDAVENDIMNLKRNVVDVLIANGISKFIMIIENVLNFHSSDESYYEEWAEDLNEEGGWIVMLNTSDPVYQEMRQAHLNHYVFFQQYEAWRTQQPAYVYHKVEEELLKKLN